MKPKKTAAKANVFGKWKGLGRLPIGGSVDSYLKRIRDAKRQ